MSLNELRKNSSSAQGSRLEARGKSTQFDGETVFPSSLQPGASSQHGVFQHPVKPLLAEPGGVQETIAVRCRVVREADCLMTLEWANDPLCRQMGFGPTTISLEDHVVWFRNALASETFRLLVVEGQIKDRWTPVGLVRMDRDGEVSLSIAAEFRGRRLAVPSLQAAFDWIQSEWPVTTFVAHIKPDNVISIRAFEAAGFQYVGETVVKGHRCLEYVHRRPAPDA